MNAYGGGLGGKEVNLSMVERNVNGVCVGSKIFKIDYGLK